MPATLEALPNGVSRAPVCCVTICRSWGYTFTAFTVPEALARGIRSHAIRHRNRLDVMTATPLALDAAITTINLPLLDQATFGIDGRKSITGALPVQALWAGEVTFDQRLKYTGENNDRDPILQTVGGSVPTNVKEGSLP
jgi:hypothetical protein